MKFLKALPLIALMSLALAAPVNAAEINVSFPPGQTCGDYRTNPANHWAIYLNAGQQLKLTRLSNVGKIVMRTDNGGFLKELPTTQTIYYTAPYAGYFEIHFLPLNWNQDAIMRICKIG